MLQIEQSLEPAAVRSRGTLVICPVSLVGQWCSEARSKLKGGSNLKIHEYHGQRRIRDPKILATFDLVVTTYETLSADIRKFMDPLSGGGKNKKKYQKSDYEAGGTNFPACHSVNWFRIVMDESHKSKGKSGVSESLEILYSKRRWCVTGTPMGNTVADLAGQFGALGIPSLKDQAFWNNLIPKPSRSGMRYGHTTGLPAVMSILRRVLFRHSKNMKYVSNGAPLLELPPKVEHIQWIGFSEPEAIKYRQIEQYCKKQYELIASFGETFISKSTIKLLSLVKDMQMVCSGGYMPARLATILNRDAGELENDAADIPLEEDDILGSQDGECSICLSLYDTPVDTRCGHRYCAECITSYLQSGKGECPLCRTAVNVGDLMTPDGQAYGATEAAAKGVDRRAMAIASVREKYGLPDILQVKSKEELAEANAKSTTSMLSKLTWLVSKVGNILTEDRTSKILVFTQFATTLDWLSAELPKLGLQYRTLTGSMTMKARKEALAAFQNDPPTTVFLLSMRAGAVGINLTQANHVIVLEPCLNKALEDQAIGRVHRMGQTREVHVWKVACLNTVEEKILKLQEQKMKSGAGGTATVYGGTPKLSNTPKDPTVPSDGLSVLPLKFEDISVSNSQSAANGKQNLLATGPQFWAPSCFTEENNVITINMSREMQRQFRPEEVSYTINPGFAPCDVRVCITKTKKNDVSGKPFQQSQWSQYYHHPVDQVGENPLRHHVVLEREELNKLDKEVFDKNIHEDSVYSKFELHFRSNKEFQITHIRIRGTKAQIDLPTVSRNIAQVTSRTIGSSSGNAAQPQQVSGSITSDRAVVNSSNFEILFNINELPTELLESTRTPENIFHYDPDQPPPVIQHQAAEDTEYVPEFSKRKRKSTVISASSSSITIDTPVDLSNSKRSTRLRAKKDYAESAMSEELDRAMEEYESAYHTEAVPGDISVDKSSHGSSSLIQDPDFVEPPCGDNDESDSDGSFREDEEEESFLPVKRSPPARKGGNNFKRQRK
jgi:superfamily II DNA or RNA helicase